MQGQKIRSKILRALAGHVCLKVCLYHLLAVKSASCDCSRKFCCKIWHQVALYLCRSLWLDNPQPGEHRLCDYCLGCRFIKSVWCTLLYLGFRRQKNQVRFVLFL